MLFYTLNKNIDGNKVVKDIINMIEQLPQDDVTNTVLTISLQKIQNCTNDSWLPKIEYKNPEP